MAAYGPAADRPGHAKRPRSGRAGRRFLAFLLVVLLFAGAVAAAVAISASTSNDVVHYRKVVAHDADSAIKQFEDLVNQYTK